MSANLFGGATSGGLGSGVGGGLGGLSAPLGSMASSVNSSSAGLPPAGAMAGLPLVLLTRNSSPHEVAAAIIREGHRRGYTPYQITAILSACFQESGLNPRAISPNGLWEGLFQQDASYAGRRDPNRAITEFFNRLDHHGGPGSPDIWKSIFWLQQRPGDSSAAAAVTAGRSGYLSEIKSKLSIAVQIYKEVVESHSAANNLVV